MSERRDAPTLYCQVTGSLCGTDTWVVGVECPCGTCQAWLYERDLLTALEHAERALGVHLEDRQRQYQRANDAWASEQEARTQLAQAEQRGRAAREAFEELERFDLSPMFDAKGSYTTRKAAELAAIKSRLRAALTPAEGSA